MSTLVMPGIENIAGQYRGTLLIESLASRRPVRWRVKCEQCGLSTVIDHIRLQNGAVTDCPNARNHSRAPLENRTTLMQANRRIEAVRSRDSDSARQFQQQSAQPERQVIWKNTASDKAMQDASPDSMMRYLDYLEDK